MSRTWKDDSWKSYGANRNDRKRRKQEKKRLKERRKATKLAERETFAENGPVESFADRAR